MVGPVGAGRAHGFLLQRGHLTPFDVPGAVADFNFWITDNHTITGTYRAPDDTFHGFIADPMARGILAFGASRLFHDFRGGKEWLP